ncbi:PqqD family protein [Sphingobacterium alkalisoli]|uniref:PqqD family protein n=1 Tax=Sphingobacterium alkalisoli TaxID=1874115 RepID=A0A4U0GMQ8_9SPHI|nr:PqqD family protein [Sphingobacterium alkalisoli]TJY60130.1 PqqD family protein [Sphingobacterium alkalisoli]
MRIREDLKLRQIGDDYIVVEPGQDMVDMSKVYTLNETAAWLWNALKGKDFSVETVVELLRNEYDVKEKEAQEDVAKLLAIFEEQGLLEA